MADAFIPPPPDPHSADYYSHRKTTLIILYSVALSLGTLVVALRFYTRSRISRYLGADDWWMLVAWVFSVINVYLWMQYLAYGSWKHGIDIPFDMYSKLFQILWFLQWVYTLSAGVVKMSILTFYLRIFHLQSDAFRYVIYAYMVFLVCGTLTITLTIIFQCLPVQSYWLFLTPRKRCLNPDVLLYVASAWILVTDVSILLLPSKFLWRLRVSTWERVQVAILLGLGSITCIASAFRVRYLFALTHSQDRFYDGFEYSYWSAIELFLGIVTTSLPACKPFYIKYIYEPIRRCGGTRTPGGSDISTPRMFHKDQIALTPMNSRRQLRTPNTGDVLLGD